MKSVVMNSMRPEKHEYEFRGRILVIEDNPKNRKLIRSLLEIHHFEVLEAPDAEAGIQMAGSCSPDLILMDIQLPGMDGLQATRIIKKTPELKDIGIVALTSYAMEGDSQKAEAAGCDGYLTKPIDTRRFIDDITPYLPQKADAAGAKGLGPDEVEPPKLLIVDDDPMNLKLLRAKLSKDYSRIVEAADGMSALEKANETLPDIILLDVMMPGLDGFEVTRQLKANPDTKEIPIILITALDGHDYKVMGYEAGADDFLNKPINTFELLTRVKSLLQMKQCQDRLSGESDSAEDAGRTGPTGGNPAYPIQKISVMLEDIEAGKTIQMYLFGQGYNLVVHGDYEQATEYIRDEHPDILIVDSRFLKEKGLQWCLDIKKDEGTDTCQVLYITTEKDLEYNFSQFEDCVDDFLTQPINIYELRARLKVLIKKKAFLDRLFNGQGQKINTAITDQLTGLYNFEYCLHVLKHEIQRSTREHSKVALVMMAVKEWPTSQHSIGHSAGDPLYGELSDIIRNSIRKLDIAARRSKQTFAFVLPEADNTKTLGFIQRLESLICSELTVQFSSGQSSENQFLFGYAICPDDSNQLDELIRIADAKLEKEKAMTATP